jgi:hypothetical protein
MPILGVIDSAKTGNLVTGSYESIQTFTGNGSQSSFSFSSIPQTYTHLQVRVYVNNTNSAGDWRGVSFKANNDSGSNYWWHYGYRAGASSQGTSNSQTTSWGNIKACITNSFNGAGTAVYDIYDYTNTNKFKTLTFLSGLSRNNNAGGFAYGEAYTGSQLWRSTAAITSLDFTISTDNFGSGTVIALYGIKA